MSAIINIKKAAERRLQSAFPTTPIAFENVKFEPTSALYFKTQFVISPPDDPVIGDKYYRERMQFQVFVCDKVNAGTANALTIAEQIRVLFAKATTMQEAGTNIYVFTTPQVSGSIVAQDRLIVPVIISLVGEVFTL
jgi:Bacteriophage related domain of unknown function